MPAALISIGSRIRAEFSVVSLALPGKAPIPFGILLLDGSGDLHVRMRDDLDQLPLSEQDQEYAQFLAPDFETRGRELGGAEFLRTLEDQLTGFVRVSDREPAAGRSIEDLLTRLFDRHVDARVRPFVTHLPVFGLRAAATKFSHEQEVDTAPERWVRAPDNMRLADDLFVVHVIGRSMEPLIPDGGLAVFRKIRPGSRVGKRLLIEEVGASGTSARFTVKKYSSRKRATEESWEQISIRLEPVNKEFEAFELDAQAFENRYRVLGEFVAVLPEDDAEE